VAFFVSFIAYCATATLLTFPFGDSAADPIWLFFVNIAGWAVGVWVYQRLE
jgi:hypothetical protein